MNTYIALFRGINVGGRNSIKMADLRALLGELGLKDVRSYIQSGNVVFRSASVHPKKLGDRIRDEIDARYGFSPRVLILEGGDFARVVEENPFPEAESDDRRLHLYFLSKPPWDPDLGGLEEVKDGSERFELKESVFYLHAPDGIGRSKLANNVEKYIGVPMTGRNWRTVCKIREMLEEYQ